MNEQTIPPQLTYKIYYLQSLSKERLLLQLLEKSLQRKWRALVVLANQEEVSHYDKKLWTYSNKYFLAHGTSNQAYASSQPILLSLNTHNINNANVLFYTHPASLPHNLLYDDVSNSCHVDNVCVFVNNHATDEINIVTDKLKQASEKDTLLKYREEILDNRRTFIEV